ncbi:MAG: amidohydrolase, partial [Rhodobacteraceae bacterium]
LTRHVGLGKDWLAGDAEGLRNFGKICVRAGVTTAADLANLQEDESIRMMSRVTSEPDFPTRIVSLRYMQGISPKEVIKRVLDLKEKSSENLRLGAIKVVVDGSIQGFTARLKWPGYFNGAPNGLWYTAPEHIQEAYELALENNILVHTHTNGDQATELVLDTLENALLKHPSNDHRFTLQHCQLANSSQFRRMKKLGLCVNLFANHLYYWGEEHYGKTVGPERAERMNSCKTALDNNVPLAIHSDAPVTPLGPLFTAWCAINRQTISGRILGESERISIDQALRAITLGAAYTLKLDSEIGSIEVGKKADFAVLEDDPYDVSPENIKDIKVWGTVQSGRIFSAENI